MVTRKLKILSAGAGAGKTYSLSSAIVGAIQNGVFADRIMATTFTKKAAQELSERVRRMLLAKGERDAAAAIADGYVGTMNSVFGRLLGEFAFTLGLSPYQTVVAEEDALVLFQSVVSNVIDAYYAQCRDALLRMQLDESWQKTVLTIIQVARQNDLTADDVRACGEYSWQTLVELLPEESQKSARELDEALNKGLRAVRKLLPGDDTTKTTAKEIEKIDEAIREWDHSGTLTWQRWAQLAKLKPAKASVDTVSPITVAAAIHDCHPRLREDMRLVCRTLFHCAADSMEEYAKAKTRRGLVDFTDQEAIALRLLANADAEEAVRDRISHVFVDEFQDSSPLQLALITRLCDMADGSVWVGDVKQAIFGFRDTDPSLMNSAMEHLSDVEVEILDTSYRSRRTLVEFVNSLFVPAFVGMGQRAETIALKPHREDDARQAASLEVWFCPHQTKAIDVMALASGVRDLLQRPSQHMVVDKVTREVRPLVPSDIAILCRSNRECAELADTLAALQVKATVGRGGLLETPEVVLAEACFRYLVDDRDTLALAEILHFGSDTWSDGKWLEGWSEDLRNDERIAALDGVRPSTRHMSPSELVTTAMAAARLDELVLAFGDAENRLANLDALRQLAITYEDTCEVTGIAASAAGFIRFLDVDAANSEELNRVPETDAPDAVRVLTYHRSKGLEWPVVILTSLQQGSERKGYPAVFNQVTAVSSLPFDVHQPLRGRKLYYWPWPYGRQQQDVGLDAHVASSRQLVLAKRLRLEENIRLLYVGMTRARDYLILATGEGAKALWLQEVRDEAGQMLLRLPSRTEVEPSISSITTSASASWGEQLQRDAILSTMSKLEAGARSFPCKVVLPQSESSRGSIELHEEFATTPFIAVSLPPHERRRHVKASFQPSRRPISVSSEPAKIPNAHQAEQLADWETKLIPQVVSFARRIPVKGEVDMASLGDMVHNFLAADYSSRPINERLAVAKSLQTRFGIIAISAEDMVDVSDRLNSFLALRYPEVRRVLREWPIHLRVGNQTASGWIDLLLELDDGYILIDHKTFPGRESSAVEKAESYLPQLQTYAIAVEKATGRPVLEALIHMPMLGCVVQFSDVSLSERRMWGSSE